MFQVAAVFSLRYVQNVGAAIFGVLDTEANDPTESQNEFQGTSTIDEAAEDILARTRAKDLTQRTIEAHLRDHIDSSDMLGAGDDTGKSSGASYFLGCKNKRTRNAISKNTD